MKQREIKFRVWDKYNKKMIKLGSLENISMRKTAGYDDDFANFEVQQFTGLKDRKGVEIYEGDICKEGNLIYEVKAGNGLFELWLGDYGDTGIWNVHNRLEVIGNIYEKSEELKNDRGDDSAKYEGDSKNN